MRIGSEGNLRIFDFREYSPKKINRQITWKTTRMGTVSVWNRRILRFAKCAGV